ncbi:interleukin-4 receptor subunit alpha [Petromyzon marinus]|uniref:interleukin-4 receptor subunit alpha n=1 Tax=Petromyzon marinus TaxID=7757 RepID=UPI003F70A4AF
MRGAGDLLLVALVSQLTLRALSTSAKGHEGVHATHVSCSSENVNLTWDARCTWTPGRDAKASNVTYRVSFLDHRRKAILSCKCEDDASVAGGNKGCWDHCQISKYNGSSSSIEFVSVAPWSNGASEKQLDGDSDHPFNLCRYIIPSSPTGLRVEKTDNMMYRVSWNEKQGLHVPHNYEVSYQEAPNGKWKTMRETDMGYLMFKKKHLGSGGDFNLRVRAGIRNTTLYTGHWGPWSAVVQFQVPVTDEGSPFALVITIFACLIVLGVLSVMCLVSRKRLKKEFWPNIPNFEPFITNILEGDDLRFQLFQHKKPQGWIVEDQAPSKVEVVSEVEVNGAEKLSGLPVPLPHHLSHLQHIQVRYSSIARPKKTMPLFTIVPRLLEKDIAGPPGGWLHCAAEATLLDGTGQRRPLAATAPDGERKRASLLRHVPEHRPFPAASRESNYAGGGDTDDDTDDDDATPYFGRADDKLPFLDGTRAAPSRAAALAAHGIAPPQGFLLRNVGRAQAYDRLLDGGGSRGGGGGGGYSVSGASGADDYVSPSALWREDVRPILGFGDAGAAGLVVSVSAAASSEMATAVEGNGANGGLKYVTLIHNLMPLSSDGRLDRRSGCVEFEERLSSSDYCREAFLSGPECKMTNCGSELCQSVKDDIAAEIRTATSNYHERQRLPPLEEVASSGQVESCAFSYGVEMHNGYVSEAAAFDCASGIVRAGDAPQYIRMETAPRLETGQLAPGRADGGVEELAGGRPALASDDPKGLAASEEFGAGSALLPLGGYACGSFAASLTRLGCPAPSAAPAATAAQLYADTVAMQSYASVLVAEYPGAHRLPFRCTEQAMGDWVPGNPQQALCGAVACSGALPLARAGAVATCGYVTLP